LDGLAVITTKISKKRKATSFDKEMKSYVFKKIPNEKVAKRVWKSINDPSNARYSESLHLEIIKSKQNKSYSMKNFCEFMNSMPSDFESRMFYEGGVPSSEKISDNAGRGELACGVVVFNADMQSGKGDIGLNGKIHEFKDLGTTKMFAGGGTMKHYFSRFYGMIDSIEEALGEGSSIKGLYDKLSDVKISNEWKKTKAKLANSKTDDDQQQIDESIDTYNSELLRISSPERWDILKEFMVKLSKVVKSKPKIVKSAHEKHIELRKTGALETYEFIGNDADEIEALEKGQENSFASIHNRKPKVTDVVKKERKTLPVKDQFAVSLSELSSKSDVKDGLKTIETSALGEISKSFEGFVLIHKNEYYAIPRKEVPKKLKFVGFGGPSQTQPLFKLEI
jgi:hypothetical protein